MWIKKRTNELLQNVTRNSMEVTIMFLETLDDHRIELLKKIVNKVDIGEYYMAGGTALSLQLELRKSVDFVYTN